MRFKGIESLRMTDTCIKIRITCIASHQHAAMPLFPSPRHDAENTDTPSRLTFISSPPKLQSQPAEEQTVRDVLQFLVVYSKSVIVTRVSKGLLSPRSIKSSAEWPSSSRHAFVLSRSLPGATDAVSSRTCPSYEVGGQRYFKLRSRRPLR